MIFSAEAEIRWLDHCEAMLSRHAKDRIGCTPVPRPEANVQPEVRR